MTAGESRGVNSSPVTSESDSGNVFADLGFAEPEEELTKAQLASQIREINKRRRLTQTAAATLMGVDQPKISALLGGRLGTTNIEPVDKYQIGFTNPTQAG